MLSTYTLSEAEVVGAMQVHGGWRNRFWLALGLVLLALAVLGFSFLRPEVVIGAIAGGAIGYLLVRQVCIPWHARRQFRQNRALRSESSALFSKEGAVFTSVTGEGRLPWADIHQWRYGRGIYLLYITSHMFYIVPGRTLE
ncbi:MAG: YcxB family protein, partial [Parahaliea sp.]